MKKIARISLDIIVPEFRLRGLGKNCTSLPVENHVNAMERLPTTISVDRCAAFHQSPGKAEVTSAASQPSFGRNFCGLKVSRSRSTFCPCT